MIDDNYRLTETYRFIKYMMALTSKTIDLQQAIRDNSYINTTRGNYIKIAKQVFVVLLEMNKYNNN